MGTISKSWSKNSNQVRLDRDFLLGLIILMGTGIILVYSASFILASQRYGDGLYFFKKQLLFAGLALATIFVVRKIPYEIYRKYFWLFWAGIVLFLLTLFLPGIGHKVGGATRWIRGPLGFRFEPSELAKLSAVLIFAHLTWKQDLKSRKGFFLLAAAFVPLVLMYFQPDFGSMVIYLITGFSIAFCAGLKWRYIWLGLLSFIPVLGYLVLSSEYRRERIIAFLNPWADAAGGGFQIIQSMLGLYSGGVFGAGLGKGQAKLFFLPEAHTDFILSVLGEETGFVGLAMVIALSVWLVVKGIQISLQCKEPFGQRLGIGITSLFGCQFIINAGVITGLLPTKGLTMPLLSYGGSSLLVTAAACGILLNIYQSSNRAH